MYHTTENRDWKVLCWNIRGMNSDDKLKSIKDKVEEGTCSVLCPQETTQQFFFYHSYLKKFTPRCFNIFAFSASHDTSGGLLTAWASSSFSGRIVHQLSFALTVEFHYVHNSKTWMLTNVYGPYDGQARDDFLNWLTHLTIPYNVNCIF